MTPSGPSTRSESSPILVLLPGLDGTGILFRWFLEALPRDVEAIVLSYPARVDARYDDLVELVRGRLPVNRPFVLVAESFSGPIALRIAAEAPAGLAGLVLVASFISSPAGRWGALLSRWAQPWFLPVPWPLLPLRFLLMNKKTPGEVPALLRQTLRAMPSRVLTTRLIEAGGIDVRSCGPKCGVPVLYLRPVRDRVLPGRCVQGVKEVLPGVTIVEVDAPHFVLQCAPHEAIKAMRSFALF